MKLYILPLVFVLTAFNVKAQKTDPWTVYMMPSDVHKMLGDYNGNFALEITM